MEHVWISAVVTHPLLNEIPAVSGSRGESRYTEVLVTLSSVVILSLLHCPCYTVLVTLSLLHCPCYTVVLVTLSWFIVCIDLGIDSINPHGVTYVSLLLQYVEPLIVDTLNKGH